MSLAPWRVLARAEMTRTVAHGDRYLETRVFLADGRVMEQVNIGIPDLENDWREVGRSNDLNASLRQLRREGWEIQPRLAHGSVGGRAIPLLVSIAVLVAVLAYAALNR